MTDESESDARTLGQGEEGHTDTDFNIRFIE